MDPPKEQEHQESIVSPSTDEVLTSSKRGRPRKTKVTPIQIHCIVFDIFELHKTHYIVFDIFEFHQTRCIVFCWISSSSQPTKFIINQKSNTPSTPRRSKRIKHVADKTANNVPEVSSSEELLKVKLITLLKVKLLTSLLVKYLYLLITLTFLLIITGTYCRKFTSRWQRSLFRYWRLSNLQKKKTTSKEVFWSNKQVSKENCSFRASICCNFKLYYCITSSSRSSCSCSSQCWCFSYWKYKHCWASIE